MRKVKGFLVAVGLLAVLLGPAPAPALLISQCGGTYSRTTSCTFAVAGPTFYVSGNTSVQSIEVRITDPAGAVSIVKCYGSFQCSAQMGPNAMGTDSFGVPGGVLTCTVVTPGSGYFGCASII